MKQLTMIMKGFKCLFFSSNFPFYRQFGHAPSKRSTNRVLGRLCLTFSVNWRSFGVWRIPWALPRYQVGKMCLWHVLFVTACRFQFANSVSWCSLIDSIKEAERMSCGETSQAGFQLWRGRKSLLFNYFENRKMYRKKSAVNIKWGSFLSTLFFFPLQTFFFLINVSNLRAKCSRKFIYVFSWHVSYILPILSKVTFTKNHFFNL